MAVAQRIDALLVSAEADVAAAHYLARVLQDDGINALTGSVDDANLFGSPDGPLGSTNLVLLVIGKAGVHPVMESIAGTASGRVIVVTLADVGRTVDPLPERRRYWIRLPGDIFDPIQAATFVNRIREILAEGNRPPETNAESATQSPPPTSKPGKVLSEAQRLTDAAERAQGRVADVLQEAWDIARAAQQKRVHVPYALQALYKLDKRSQQAMDAAGDPPGRFLETLAEGGRRTERSRSPGTIEGIPPLSGHVKDGLLFAVSLADARGAGSTLEPFHLLLGILSVTGCSMIGALVPDGITLERVESSDRRLSERSEEGAGRDYIAGYRSDGIGDLDLLGIEDEVEAMAMLLASRNLEPPLALGLFGDWGTGKTFFMAKLQERIRQKATREAARIAKDPAARLSYCQSIVQLRFNAWHYIDKELWASLADAIFEGLDEAVKTRALDASGMETRSETRVRLLAEQAANRLELDAAQRATAEAQDAVREASAQLVALDAADDALARSVGFSDVVAGVYRVVAAVPEVGQRADEILNEVDHQIGVNAMELRTTSADLRSQLGAGAAGRLRTGWRSLIFRRRNLLTAAIAVLAILSVGGFLWASGLPVAGAIVGFVGSLAAVVGAAWVAAAPVVKIIADARRESRRLIEGKRADAKQAVTDRRTDAETVAAARQQEIDQRTVRDKELADALKLTEPGQEMAQFIQMRHASNTYSSRLGVIAQARDDFEQLTTYLTAEARQQPVTDQRTGVRLVPPVERIILYIDDLDRCTEKQVVDVLQAVHLLLAFRLFVVVVAVDPRWLVRSLRVEKRALDSERNGGEETEAIPGEADGVGDWEATPMDYLEKIFQIPFALRPMDSEGFGRVIADLSKDQDISGQHGAGATSTQTNETVDEFEERAAVLDVDAEDGAEESPQRPAERAPQERAPNVAAEDQAEEVDPEILHISDTEESFMRLLYPLIPTPRSAKRFVNVYRLLKAASARSGRYDFEEPATHRPVLLLLAIATGFPDRAAAILNRLHRARDEEQSLWDLIKDARSAEVEEADSAKQVVEDWDALDQRLVEVQAELNRADGDATRTAPVLDGKLVGNWALPVARYSFEASRILWQYRAVARSASREDQPIALGRT